MATDVDFRTIPTEKGARPQYPRPVHPDDIGDPCVIANELSRERFGDSYPNPFTSIGVKDDWGRTEEYDWGDTARTLVEQRMCLLSAHLREKPRWYVKMKDPVIRARWREEALQGMRATPVKEWVLTEKMVDYVLDELEGYAKIRDEATGIEVSCYERIWKSDNLISDADHAKLLECIARLENVPADEQDWHPGSGGQVLDLVHPSLYPIVYGSTLSRDPATGELRPLNGPETGSSFRSTRFAWLPSDFAVSEDGVARLDSPYINNIHPTSHADLYTVIDCLVTSAIPLFERVLSDLRRPLSKLRMVTEPGWDRTYSKQLQIIGCIYVDSEGRSCGPPWPSDHGLDTRDWEEEQYDEWRASLPKRLPEALPKYDGALDVIRKSVSLAGSTIQIIVKLANICLTPKNPSYAGGSWHVEGMENEGIVSTFIYYYDERNVTESLLAFRTAILEPSYHQQDDHECSSILYNLVRDVPLVQSLGSVITSAGRCIAFPNIYQHQVQPFQLKDTSKLGHRKILALFLIDPTKPVPSATTVPPQRKDWVTESVHAGLAEKNLPVEMINAIVDEAEGVITREEAEEIRLELMAERSRMVQTNTTKRFETSFNMCEH